MKQLVLLIGEGKKKLSAFRVGMAVLGQGHTVGGEAGELGQSIFRLYTENS